MTIVGVELAAKGNFPELELEKAMGIVGSMSKHSSASFDGQVTYTACRHIPTSYIKSEKDFIVLTENQQQYIDRMTAEAGKEIDVHTINTGHVPNVTAPEKLVKIVVKIASTV